MAFYMHAAGRISNFRTIIVVAGGDTGHGDFLAGVSTSQQKFEMHPVSITDKKIVLLRWPAT